MATVAGGALLQPLIGCILYWSWTSEELNHVPVYTTGNYQLSLFVIPLCYLLATLISLRFIKETQCRQLHHMRNMATTDIDRLVPQEP